MVKSIIDNAIDYSESRAIDSADLDFDANLYETEMYKKNVIFALGKPKDLYKTNNIIYYPIYLVENDEVKMNIGVYEILTSEQDSIKDDEGDIDVNKFNKPLLFAFAYETIVGKPPFTKEIGAKEMGAKEMGAKTAASKKKIWIQKFMSDPNYNIIDVKYDGNCFFSILELALQERGQEKTIDDMRKILANNATDELFENYKKLYEDSKTEEESLTRELKNITGRHNALEATMKKTKDRNLALSYAKQSEDMKKTHNDLKKQRTLVKANINDFAFMKDVDNLSMLKMKFQMPEFWADTWAISTLERELNIKVIIFSELNYREGDIINVLQCGQLNDRILEERNKFEPSFYVLASHHGGYHYQLITYNNEKSFTFEELPKAVESLVINKCLERIAGPYSLIPEFKNKKLKMLSPEKTEATDVAAEPEPSAAAEDETTSDLYDKATLFRFYSKSNAKPFPGKGEGELLGPEGRAAYSELAKIPEWRKKLTNGWNAEFMLDNHRWASVEHYYQANKFKRNNPDFYIQFSLDSQNSEIAKDPAMAKAAGGKSGTILKTIDDKKKTIAVRPKTIVIDPDFFTQTQGSNYSRGEIVLEAAMRAKFTQNAELKTLLLATKKAKLEHVRSGKPAEVYNDLMRVRRDLRQEDGGV